jgi:hypothetical protein
VEAKGEENGIMKEQAQNGMPMFSPYHLYLDCAFFFLLFSFRF